MCMVCERTGGGEDGRRRKQHDEEQAESKQAKAPHPSMKRGQTKCWAQVSLAKAVLKVGLGQGVSCCVC